MAKKNLELPKWSGRQILDESHGEELDRRAAAHEFDKKLPRHMAEQEAYKEYQQEHHARAAAHHLMGMKSAQGAGSMDEARKHGVMYSLHVKELGEDIYGPVPQKVKHYADAPDRDKVAHFKPHKGDAFLLKDHDRGESREPRGSTQHAEPSEGIDAQKTFESAESSESQPRDASRFDIEKSEIDDERLHILYKAVSFIQKAWEFNAPSSKVGDYETKRCGNCKRDTVHQSGKCKACKPKTKPETSPQPAVKAEGKATTAEIKNDGPFIKAQQLPLIPKERSMKPDNQPGKTCRGCGGYGRVPDFDDSNKKHAKKFKPCPDCTEDTKKSEAEFDRLHDLYKAIKLLEGLRQLEKGDVIQGNFPKHKADKKAKGPAAPVVGRIGPRSHFDASYEEPPRSRPALNSFLHGLGAAQKHPTALVEGKWLHVVKPGSNAGCDHKNPQWSSSGRIAACPGCGGHFSVEPV